MRLILQAGYERMEFKIANELHWFGYFYRDSMIYNVSEEGYYTNLGGYYHWEGNIEFVIE